ncbi:MAG: hypothetical protein U9O94_06040 [Nanoarchaeota archaeon]|nr:hypothetical protein [Nanoarchaeota archaeon]
MSIINHKASVILKPNSLVLTDDEGNFDDSVKLAMNIEADTSGLLKVLKREFSKDTPNGTELVTIPADSVVKATQIRIGTIYDSVAPNIQIGTDADHSLLMDMPTAFLKEAQAYKTVNMLEIGNETIIKFFQDIDGATDGTGTLLISYI